MGLRAVAVTAGPSPSYLNPASELEPLSADEEASWGTEPCGTVVGGVMVPSVGMYCLLSGWALERREDLALAKGQSCRQGLQTQSVEPCHFPSQDGWSVSTTQHPSGRAGMSHLPQRALVQIQSGASQVLHSMAVRCSDMEVSTVDILLPLRDPVSLLSWKRPSHHEAPPLAAHCSTLDPAVILHAIYHWGGSQRST